MEVHSAKRSISDLLNDQPDDESPISKKPHLDAKEDADKIYRLNCPSLTDPPPRAPLFQHPTQLISFSYSSSRVLEFTNAALNYYVDPPPGADLSYHYETWVKRPEERGRLDGLLEACLQEQVKPERQRAGVVSWRGVMTKILTAPYEERDSWELNVMSVGGTMYLEDHLTEAKLKDKEDMTPRQRLQSYYGYAFESYCTSPTPDPPKDGARHRSGWGGDVNTNVQWCSVAKTKLGNVRMIMGGEVDCVRGRYTGQPDTFVELKTSMAIRGPQDESRFEKKLLKFYFQSFLLGVPEIVVGFRTPSGKITTLQSFKTIQIPRLVRGKPGAWDPNLCLDWGTRFLTFIKSIVDDVEVTTKSDSERLRMQESVWRVKFDPRVGVQVTLLDDEGREEVKNGEDRVGFLPRSYWEKVTATGDDGEAD